MQRTVHRQQKHLLFINSLMQRETNKTRCKCIPVHFYTVEFFKIPVSNEVHKLVFICLIVLLFQILIDAEVIKRLHSHASYYPKKEE